MLYQKTIKHDVLFEGVGLHSGEPVQVTVKPAPPNSGIVFARTDTGHYETTPAVLSNVSGATLSTALGFNGSSVGTVEHLLAALSGIGIDNAVVEVSGMEVPILDGSSAPFVAKLKEARVPYQEEAKQVVVIKEPITVRCEDKFIEAYPADRLIIDYTIDFDHPLLENQSMTFTFSYSRFEKDICAARTFCFLHEVELMRANGFAQGGSLENAVVIDGTGIINKEGLRFSNEFVRHKILDFLGDISLLGHPIVGYIKAYKSGHALNHLFLREVLNQYKKWDLARVVLSQDSYSFEKTNDSPFLPTVMQ